MQLTQEDFNLTTGRYRQAATTLSEALADVDDAQDRLYRAVQLALDEGLTWAEIGAVLGITKQGAHKRFAQVAR